MPNYQLLNNVEHANTRVITARSAEFGDNVMFAVVYPFEFRQVQACYPMVIFENPQDGQFHPVALFGFGRGENLFLRNEIWQADYIPATIQRAPFVVGFQEDPNDPLAETKRVVTIDIDHPRVSQSMGELVFTPNGGFTDYLDRITQMLESIYIGTTQNQTFIAALKRFELLRPLNLSFELKSGEVVSLEGVHIIDDEALQRLSAESLAELNAAGHLLLAYMMVASQSQFTSLINLKQQA